MSEQSFSKYERHAIWEAYDKQCFHCDKIIGDLDALKIDHLIPEKIEPERLTETISRYGLPPNFDVRSSQNTVASCERCNKLKRDHLPANAASEFMILLQAAQRRAVIVDRLTTKYRADFSVSSFKTAARRTFSTSNASMRSIDDAYQAIKAEFSDSESLSVESHSTEDQASVIKSGAKIAKTSGQPFSRMLYDAYIQTAARSHQAKEFSQSLKTLKQAQSELHRCPDESLVQEQMFWLAFRRADAFLGLGKPQQALNMYLGLIPFCEQAFGSETEQSANLIRSIAMSLMSLGRHEESIGFHDRARIILEARGDLNAVFSCLIAILHSSLCARRVSQIPAVSVALIAVAEKCGRQLEIPRLLLFYSQYASDFGFYELALQMLDAIYPIMESVPESFHILFFDIISERAKNLTLLGRFTEAVELHLSLIPGDEDRLAPWRAIALCAYGRTLIEMKNWDEAERSFEEVLLIVGNANVPVSAGLRAQCYIDASVFFLFKENLTTARRLIDAAYVLALQEPISKNSALMLHKAKAKRAEINFLENKIEAESLDDLEAAIKYFKNREMFQYLTEAHLPIGRFYLRSGDDKNALKHLLKAEKQLESAPGTWLTFQRVELWTLLLELFERQKDLKKVRKYKEKLAGQG